MIDFSEPFYYFGFIIGIYFFMINNIFFNIFISIFLCFLCLFSIWRVRKLVYIKHMNDSIDILRSENKNLLMNINNLICIVCKLEDELYKSEKNVANLNKILGIVETKDKTIDEIINELNSLIKEYDRKIKLYNNIKLFK